MGAVRSRIVLDEKEEILGSVIRITVVVPFTLRQKAQKAMEAAFEECRRLDREYSRFKIDNQLSKLNAQLDDWQEVTDELFFLLEQGQHIFQKTGGAFNLGVKSLLEQWGYDSKYSFQPSPEHHSGQQEAADFFKNPPYELSASRKVKLFYPVELGGLGKGYALDLMKKVLEDFDVFCIDAGGDLYARGTPQKNKPWEIFFEHPLDLQQAIGKVDVSGFFLAASNPLKRKWAEKYHHLVDPKSQKPADQMLAVYTQADSGLLADAYSTALFVLGYDDAKKNLPFFPVQAMLVSPSGEIYRTSKFQGELFTH